MSCCGCLTSKAEATFLDLCTVKKFKCLLKLTCQGLEEVVCELMMFEGDLNGVILFRGSALGRPSVYRK